MRFMLDTNICIFLIRKRSVKVLQEIRKHQPEDIAVSAITVAELEHGCEKSADPDRNRLALMEFLSPFTILAFDDTAALAYGSIRTDLEGKGTPIGSMDLLIAAHSKSRNLAVVTNNTREFERVEGLAVVDWAQSEV